MTRRLTVAKANGDTGSYRYDPLGRRVARRASIASVTRETYYLHNGWNVELEHDGTRYTHRRSWGLDLSGSLQGAGGVGGLIMTEHLDASGNASHNYYPSYDGNGNITALIDHQGNLAATWRYDAYGNTLATTGDPSLENYRFSTKPYDELTGFYYYGYRYYDPQTGRWPSRDPIKDLGHWALKSPEAKYFSAIGILISGKVDVNSYQLVGNSPLIYLDVNGEWGFIGAAIGFAIGGAVGLATSGGDWKAGLAGAAGGAVAGATLNLAAGKVAGAAALGALAGGAGGLAGGLVKEGLDVAVDDEEFEVEEVVESTVIGIVTGGVLGKILPPIESSNTGSQIIDEALNEFNNEVIGACINAITTSGDAIMDAVQNE